MNLIKCCTLFLPIYFLVACSGAPAPAVEATPAEPVKDTLETLEARYSYAIGMNFGKSISNTEAKVDTDILIRAMRDQLENKPMLLTDEEAETALRNLLLEIQTNREKKLLEESKKALDEQKAFLEKNKADSGVIALPSGLQYKVLRAGSGISPKPTDQVSVHYVGTLLNGTEFDNTLKRNEPLEFPVNVVIPGWQELLGVMQEGMKVKAWIPSSLAYGEEGVDPIIPGNALLVFEVELLKVLVEPPPADSTLATPAASAPADTAATAPAVEPTPAAAPKAEVKTEAPAKKEEPKKAEPKKDSKKKK